MHDGRHAKTANDPAAASQYFRDQVSRAMSFAKRVFLAAGIFGVVLLAAFYFLEDYLGRPPSLTPSFITDSSA